MLAAGAKLTLSANADLLVSGNTTGGGIAGQGQVTIGAGATLEVNSVSKDVTIKFADGTGTLKIDQQTLFKGQLDGLVPGDVIILSNTGPATNNTVFYEAIGDKFQQDGTSRGFGLYLAEGTYKNRTRFFFPIASGTLQGEYFAVKQSGADTVLTLTPGNPIDTAVKGPQARTQYGVTGNNIKIGIISNSFNALGGYVSDRASGALPTVTVVQNPNTSVFTGVNGPPTDEGRAMAQIIHAIAPDAALYFCATSGSDEAMAAAISALQQAGCNIVVDDIWSPYEDSAVKDAIDAAVRGVGPNGTATQRVTYLSAAGNNGDHSDSVFVSSSLTGHAADPNNIAVGAVDWIGTPNSPPGNASEPFSDLGAFISAPDGGPSTIPKFNPFFGTSAAAPAAAAVAALMLQQNPALGSSPKTVKQLLAQSAIPFGNSSTSGAGLIQADLAVALAKAQQVASAFYTTPGTPSGLAVTSAAISQTNGVIGSGQTAALVLAFTEPVTVSAGSTLSLNNGATATLDGNASSPSKGQLVFKYTAGANDGTTNLKITQSNVVLRDASGRTGDLSALFNVATGVTINSPLGVTSISSSQLGEATSGQTVRLTVKLNQSVTVNTSGGTPTLTLNDGATATYNSGASNLSTGTLLFDYVVGANDAIPNLAISQVNLPFGSTIKDSGGNNADFSAALNIGLGLQVGPVSVDVIKISQNEANTGKTVQLSLVLNGAVNVNTSGGSPTLTLSTGATATYDAPASNLSKGLLVFGYTVRSSDHAANVAISRVNLNGATIKDRNGVNVVLSAVSNISTGLSVNSPLSVTSVVASPLSGNATVGTTIVLSVNLSETASVSGFGTPTLTLNDGGAATYMDGDGTNALTFSYTVAGTDRSVQALAVTGVSLDGATIADSAGNNADLSGALVSFPNVRITKAPGDFTGNGTSDILWRDPSGGTDVLWTMSGGAVTGGQGLYNVPAGFSVAGFGDFNADGTADLVWRSAVTGSDAIWLMNGGTIEASKGIDTLPATWAIAGVADFNNDGTSDILLRNSTTGGNYIWTINHGQIDRTNSKEIYSVPSSWSIVGIGYFNGGSQPDILLRQASTGTNYIWTLSGNTITAGTLLNNAPAGWTVAGLGDFNGDGTTDILMRQASTGINLVWTISNAHIANSLSSTTRPRSGRLRRWRISTAMALPTS